MPLRPLSLTVPLQLVLLAVLLAACGGSPATPTPAADGLSDLHAYPELEHRLPDTVGQHQLEKVSLRFVGERQDPKTLEVLRRLGRTAEDMQLAVATGGNEVQISAFRVVGAEGAAIVSTFQQVEEEDSAERVSYGGATIGGKRLLTRETANQLTFLYPAEDIMFVLSGEREHIEEALGKLP